MSKPIVATGKRKTAIARAVLSDGKGIVRINSTDLSGYGTKMSRLKIQEPLIIAGEAASSVNIDISVIGGGPTTQADAARLAIAKALAKHDKKLEKPFLAYDRTLLVADVRRKETRKPNRHGKARSKVQKSYR